MARERSIPARPDTPRILGPIRTCIGCRARAARCELLRVTAGSDAHGHPAVVADPTRSAPGRGAHLHPTTECYDLAVRRKAFARALRAPAGLSTASVGEHLTTRAGQAPRPTITDDQDWSSSS